MTSLRALLPPPLPRPLAPLVLAVLSVLVGCSDAEGPAPLALDRSLAAHEGEGAGARPGAPDLRGTGRDAADRASDPGDNVALEPDAASPDPARTISIRIEVVTGRTSLTPVRDVPLEVGYFDRRQRRVPRLRLVADSDGIAVGELDLPPHVHAWYAIPQAPGWMREVHGKGARFEDLSVLQVALKRGGTLVGRLEDPTGAPVDGWVRLSREGLHLATASTGREGGVGGGPGSFALPFDAAGTYAVEACVEGTGSARLEGLELDPARIPEDLVLRLEGPCHVEGVLTDTTGEPLADTLVVIAHRLEPDASVRSLSDWSLHVRADGMLIDRTRTDLEGRFRLGGLAPGDFTVACDPFDSGSLDGPRLNVTLPREDALEPVRVEVQRWRVHVRDGDAEPFPLELDRSGKRMRVVRAVTGGLPTQTWVEAFEEGDGQDGQDWLSRLSRLNHEPWRPTTDPAVWDLVLRPGRAHFVRVLSPDRKPFELALPAGTGLREAELVLPPDEGLARVRLRADLPPEGDDPDGVRAWIEALGEFDVEVRRGPEQRLLARVEWEPEEPLDLELPPGSYRLGITARRSSNAARRLRTEDHRLLLPGEVAIELELAPHQSLERSVEFAPRSGVGVEVVSPDGSEAEELRARVLARPLDGSPRELRFSVDTGEGVDVGTGRLFYWQEESALVPTDEELVAVEDLAPGIYDLWAESGDLVGPVRRVELVAGRRAEVVLRLTPDPDADDDAALDTDAEPDGVVDLDRALDDIDF